MVTDEERQIIENELWGFEVHWFGIDADGFVAHFLTAGEGPVPLVGLSLLADYESFFLYLGNTKPTTEVSIIEGKGKNDTWINSAQRGLYSYDYRPEGFYTIRVAPIIPTHISCISSTYHPILQAVRFPNISLRQTPPIDLVQLDIPNSWEHRWIPPSKQNS